MSNFRKFISMSAVAILGVTNLLTPLSYASAATAYDDLTLAQLKVKMLQFMMPDKDVYLKAYTEANQYYVDYSGNTHTSGETPRTTHTYDTPGDLATNGFFKTGYSFSGWNRAADGTQTGYADGAHGVVDNWTTASGGTVDIFARWTANIYGITYDLGDSAGSSSGVHSKTPTTGAYDETLTIQEPTRQGYQFTGWTISNMDTNVHTLGSESNTGNAATATKVKGISFKNLTAISGDVVKFLAVWDPNADTPYTVEHYKQNLNDTGYPETATDTDNLTGVTDHEVTPARKTYDGFTAPVGITTGIRADGNTLVRYDYVRNHYDLTLIAGTGVATASAKGTVNTAGDSVSAGGSKEISFLYEEPVTLTGTAKPGYENLEWSGYLTTADSITMPYTDVVKEVYAKPITYTISYTYSGGTPQADPTSYTVESGTFSLANNLNRLHSTFSGWIGGVNNEITTPQKNVQITGGSIGDRHYTAVWDCLPGYHENETRDACIEDTNTAYTVKHYQEPIGGGTHVFVEEETLYGTTDQNTNAQPKNYTGFTPQTPVQKPISGDKSTVIEILYDRNEYNLTVNQPTEAEAGAIVPTVDATTLNNGKVDFDDTVTVSVVVPDGYTFVGWTGTTASGDNINFANSGSQTTTFHMPASAATVRPIVTIDSYSIQYILHNGTVDGTNPTTYNVETETFTLINPKRDNTRFVGWSGGVVDKTPTTNATVTISKGFTGDRVYEAIWDCKVGYHQVGDSCVANQYSGSVDYNDGESHGVAEVIEFTYDQVTTLDNPSQSGYDFSGWIVTGMSGGVEHTLGTLKTTENSASVDSGATQFMNLSTEQGYTDIKFTADWTPRNDTKYTVYYYYKELGKTTYELSGTAVEKEGTTDTSVTLADLAAMGGHPSEGFTYSAGYVKVTNPETRPTEGAVLTGNIDKDGNQKIYLYFTRKVHTVYLSGDAHVDTLNGSGQYEYGANVTVDMTPKAGYHFAEWKKKTDNTFNTDL